MKANAEQEDSNWMAQRAGKFTASRASDLMAKTRSGPAASRSNLITLLAVERMTGACVETYQNAAMARGIELEAEARDMFAFNACLVVEEVGFVAHPSIPNCGCSPDGLIGDDELLEIKCPASMTKHLEALRSAAHAQEYKWQLQHQLLVTQRQRVHMVSYDPRFPDGLQLAHTIVERDEKMIDELVAEMARAEIEIQGILAELVEYKEAA